MVEVPEVVEEPQTQVVGTVGGSAHAGRAFGTAGGRLAIENKTLIVMLPSGFKLSVLCKESSDRLAYYPMCSPGLSRARQGIVEAIDVGVPLNAQEAVVTGLGAAKRPAEAMPQAAQPAPTLPWRPGMKPQPALPAQEASTAAATPAALAVREPPVKRALDALRDAIVDAANSGCFNDIGLLNGCAASLRAMLVERVDDVEQGVARDGGDPYVRRAPAAMPPEGDMANILREMTMAVTGPLEVQKKEAEERAARRPEQEARMLRDGMLSELRELQEMKMGGMLPRELQGRIDTLTRKLKEAFDDDDKVVPAELLRRYPTDGAGVRDASGVGEPHAGREGGDDEPREEVQAGSLPGGVG